MDTANLNNSEVNKTAIYLPLVLPVQAFESVTALIVPTVIWPLRQLGAIELETRAATAVLPVSRRHLVVHLLHRCASNGSYDLTVILPIYVWQLLRIPKLLSLSKENFSSIRWKQI